jgi:protein subunit release factor B
MARLGIREEDLEETFIRSRGKGGQNVNKVSTCVVLVHRPSGVTVRCEEERSQAMNRYRARARLADRIEERVLGERSAARQAAEKVRRQKRRRSRKAKEKVLAAKHRRSETLAARKTDS